MFFLIKFYNIQVTAVVHLNFDLFSFSAMWYIFTVRAGFPGLLYFFRKAKFFYVNNFFTLSVVFTIA